MADKSGFLFLYSFARRREAIPLVFVLGRTVLASVKELQTACHQLISSQENANLFIKH
jgi:hypothetical protein